MKSAKFFLASWIGLAALTASVQAAPVDLLDLNPNLAIYHTELPTAVEIDVFMISNTGSMVNWASLDQNTDAHDVRFDSNADVKAANGGASLKEIYTPPDPKKGDPAVGAEFLTLNITVPGFQFGDLLFDTQKAHSFSVSVFSDAFSLLNPLGSYSFSGLGPDESVEKFMVLATGPYAITRVLLSAMTGDSLFEVKHFKLSELQAYNGGCRPGQSCGSTPEVPLPAALPLFVGALGGLTWLSRNRKRKLAA